MLLLMTSRSNADADQLDGLLVKGCQGGGPVVDKGSAAVDDNFEFGATGLNLGGGFEKSMSATSGGCLRGRRL